MNAGESARREAHRARERAERLARRADMFDKGAEGETRTASARGALGPEWIVFHDHRWPGRRLANIDHIVVGPGGIFVVDSKNWSGDVSVHGRVLRQNGRSREKAVASAADASLAIAELVPTHAHLVRAVLCFARDDDMSGWVRDVMVCSTSNVARMLASRPRLLDEARVRELALSIDVELRATASAPPRSHTSTALRNRPATPRSGRSATPRRTPTRKGRTSSPGRLLVPLIGGLALLASLQTGLLPAATKALSEAFVDDLTSTAECKTSKKSEQQAGDKRPEQRPKDCN
jgi:hypothetical protein